MLLELDKSAQDVAAEGAILSEMLEIVSKRAALRPSEQSTNSIPSENISLPLLPPQTTINPLLQHQYNQQQQQQQSSTANTSHHFPSYTSGRPNIATHHTFTSQSHNQEHNVSSYNHDLFDGTEHIYLRTNLSLLHDCEVLMENYERQFQSIAHPASSSSSRWLQFNAHTVLVIVEFFILYIGVLVYSLSRL